MDIVLFGIQGSGKGTLGKALATEYNFHYFETGGALRKLSQEDSVLGKKVKNIVESGQLVPNDIVMEIIEDFLKKVPANERVVFDGIPRKIEQAETFEELMKKSGRDFIGILVEVPQDIALKRLTTRRICASCKEVYPLMYKGETCEKCHGQLITRSDDTPESIKTRIELYYKETVPVIERYENQGKLKRLDGTASIEEVRKAFFELVEKIV